MIADTTFLIDLMRRDPSAIEKAKNLEEQGVAILVSSPTTFELFVGASMSRKREEEKSKIISTVGSLPQLALDYESARAGGEIFVMKMRAGSMVDAIDAMLAGLSKIHKEAIITRNIRHFLDIEDVRTEGY